MTLYGNSLTGQTSDNLTGFVPLHARATGFILLYLCAQLAVVAAPGSKSDHSRYPSDEATLTNGRTLFSQSCASCHALKEDTLGPPLGGITELKSRDELLAFILDPAKAINSGDARAKALNERYKLVMPGTSYLTPAQITDILAYISHESAVQQLQPFTVPPNRQFTKGDRVVAPVKDVGLVVELEDYLRIPVQAKHPPDKGIATLRAHPLERGVRLVSDQMGRIYRTVPQGEPTVFLELRNAFPHFIFQPGIGTSLGSFALHPGFRENGLLYTTHAEKPTGQPAVNEGDFPADITAPLQWVLIEWKMDDPHATTFVGRHREVLRVDTPSTAHGFQDIGFAPVPPGDADYGMLYVGCGDGGANNLKRPELCQDTRSLLGTILHIDPRGTNGVNGQYGIPEANPFSRDPDPKVRREIWAYGFRNPHRMCWDSTSGLRLIVADIGESNVEEVNIVEKGGDYGWSRIEGLYGIDTKVDAKIVFTVPPMVLAPYRRPFGQFDHQDGKAISGGFVYQGPIPELRNKYIFGDIVTGKLFYMNLDATLSDSTVYALNIFRDDQATSIMKLSKLTRAHLRIGYDENTGDLFVMTKADGMIRRVTRAHQHPPISMP